MLDNPVIVMSFAPTALRRVKLLAPDVPTVLLMERLFLGRHPRPERLLLPAWVPIAGPGLKLLHTDPELVERAHARGHPVFVWTVDEPRRCRICGRSGSGHDHHEPSGTGARPAAPMRGRAHLSYRVHSQG